MLSLRKKNWVIISTAVVAPLLLVAVLAVNKINEPNSAFAVDSSVFEKPSGYTKITDSAFYACVVGDFIEQYPNEEIPTTGLTDQQLGKIRYLGKNSYSVCAYGYIENWTGLEKMTALTVFYDRFDGDYSSINFSNNTNLSRLYLLGHNNLPDSLDFSRNTALTILNIARGDSTSINLSRNTALTHLAISDLDATSITLPEGNNNLVFASLSSKIPSGTYLDFSKYPNLTYLRMSGVANFKYINVSKNTNLKTLEASGDYIFAGMTPRAVNDNYVYDFNQVKYLTNGDHKSSEFPGSSEVGLSFSGSTIGYNGSTFSIYERNGISYDTNNALLTVSRGYSLGEIQLNVDSPELNSTTRIGFLKLPKVLDFNANGGIDYTNTSICHLLPDDSSCTVTIPEAKPVRSNYYFLGWADSVSATSSVYQPGATVSLNANKTLHAIWAPIYTLNFDANGGSNVPANQTCHPNATSGTCAVTIPSTTPTRGGYTFLGYADWNDLLAGSIMDSGEVPDYTIYTAGSSVTLSEDRTFYTMWKKVDDSEEPTDPDDPLIPSPGDIITPLEPVDPDDPTDPDDPSNPDEPSDPDNPSNPDEPSNPDGPTAPDNPVNPDDPENPEGPNTGSTKAVIWRQGQKYVKHDGESIVLAIDYLFDRFDKVLIDEAEVPTASYKVESETDSTKITIYDSYLDALENGTHTLRVVFTDDVVADSSFTIVANSGSENDENDGEEMPVPNTSSPDTGGNTKAGENGTSTMLYALPVVVALGLVTVYIVHEKRSHRKFD